MKSKLILSTFLLGFLNLDAMNQVNQENQSPFVERVEENSNNSFSSSELREDTNDREEMGPLLGECCRSDEHCIQIRWLTSGFLIIPQLLQACVCCRYYGFTPAGVALSVSAALSMFIATTITLVDSNSCNFEFIKTSVNRIRSYTSRHSTNCLLGSLALCGGGSLLVQLCEMPLVPCKNSFLEGAAREFCNNTGTNINMRDVMKDSAGSITTTGIMCLLSFFLAFGNLLLYVF